MPSSILYHLDPKTSNRIAWYILIAVFVLTFIGFLYYKFISNGKASYEQAFYERISGIRIPGSSSIIGSYDNGEFWTATSFRINKDSLSEFVMRYNFQKDDSDIYKPKLFAETLFKVEKLKSDSNKYLYNTGTKGKNSWLYVVDPERHLLWAEIQYPDWAGN